MTDKARNQKKIPVIVASHTHWDRAWYQPFQKLRSRLVHMVDELLEIIKRKDFKCFNFDGQTVVLEDYLAIRPEKRAEISRLVKSGKLKIGPWYVLADEFLAGGESLIRNLLIGHKVAKEFGAVAKVGYTPDSFGHVSQMPQILNGFGINSFIFARGLSPDGAKMGQVFNWKSLDGKSDVYACWTPRSYGHPPLTIHVEDGKRFPLPWSAIKERIIKDLSELDKFPHPGVLLLCNGNDHAHAEERIGEIITLANREIEYYHFEHAGFDRYTALVAIPTKNIPSYSGELRDGGPMGILSGTQSSRMYLKQANADCIATLTSLAEPIACMADIAGFPYPHAEINHAWMKLLKNHPHDDICGCSVDSVHRDMETRFRNCLELAEQLTFRSLYWISHTAKMPKASSARVFAGHGLPASKAYRFTHTFDIPDEKPRTSVVNSSGIPQPTMPGKVTSQIVEDWDIRTGTFRIRTAWKQEMHWLGTLPPCGYEQFVPTFEKNPATDVSAQGNTIENSLARVQMHSDGSVTITDKKTGKTIVGNIFEDNEDSGDGYDYSRLRNSPPTISSKGIRGKITSRLIGSVCADVSCEFIMEVPEALTLDHKARSANTVSLKIKTTGRLLPNERRVEFHTVVNNNAKDHRLRAVFNSGVEKAETVDVESAFDVVTRNINLPPESEMVNWGQKPIPTKHQAGFVSVSDGEKGVTLINRGMPEYEARRDGSGISLIVTLFRAFSHLAMDDHFERGSAAGPIVPTPDAQMQGEFNAHYAVVFHEGTWENAQTWQDSYAFNSPAGLMESFTETPSGKLPASASLLEIDNPAAVISAVKGAESGKGIVIRLWNISAKPISPTIKTLFEITSATHANMLERPTQKLSHKKHSVKLPKINPKEIVTLLLGAKPLAPKCKSTQIMWATCATAQKVY